MLEIKRATPDDAERAFEIRREAIRFRVSSTQNLVTDCAINLAPSGGRASACRN